MPVCIASSPAIPPSYLSPYHSTFLPISISPSFHSLSHVQVSLKWTGVGCIRTTAHSSHRGTADGGGGGGIAVLQGVCGSASPGEMVALLGPSGAGVWTRVGWRCGGVGAPPPGRWWCCWAHQAQVWMCMGGYGSGCSVVAENLMEMGGESDHHQIPDPSMRSSPLLQPFRRRQVITPTSSPSACSNPPPPPVSTPDPPPPHTNTHTPNLLQASPHSWTSSPSAAWEGEPRQRSRAASPSMAEPGRI